MSISVVIVEDEKHYSNALKNIIDYQEDLEVVAQFFSGEEALKLMGNYDANVVLVDIQLQDMFGYDIVPKLKELVPAAQFMMCTSFEDDDKIFKSLKAGASGYLIKGEPLEKILQGIREVHYGGAPMSFAVARRVLGYFERKPEDVEGVEDLSPREREVLELLAGGFMYKEIADKKKIAIDTVKKHVVSIYTKLHVSNKVEAVNKYNRYHG